MANEGKLFEKHFRGSIPSSIYHYRLKDDTSGFAGISNPCDIVVYNYPSLHLMELKSHNGLSIPFTAIRKAQWEGLEKASKYTGVYAGVVMNFRQHGITFYVPIENLVKFRDTCGKKSVNIHDLKKIGLVVGQTLKRKYYTYHIEELLKEITTWS